MHFEQARILDLVFDPSDDVIFPPGAGSASLAIYAHNNNLFGAGGLRVAVKLKGTDGTLPATHTENATDSVVDDF